jgi:hypothetical protein
MKKGGFCSALLVLLALAALLSGWTAREAGAAPEEKLEAPPKVGEDGGPTKALGPGQSLAPEEVCPGTFGPLITDTAVPIEKGKFALQPTFALSFVTSSLDKNWRRVSAGGDFGSFTQEYKITLGLWDNLEGFVVIPVQVNWVTNADEPGPHGERAALRGGWPTSISP